MAIEVTATHDPKDILKQVYDPSNQKKGYELAASKGITFSAFLETISPTKPGEPLDAYERLLKHCGIVLKDDPDHGIYASKGALFFQSNLPEARVLFPEFINRTIRAAMMDEANVLDYLVAGWDIADSNVFRSFYFDDTATQRKAGRLAEGAKPRKFKVTWSEKAVYTKDFSIELDMTYEFVRWASLPVIQLALKRVALERQQDEVAEAIYVYVNGDGTSKEGGAITPETLSDYNITSGGITYEAYLKWLAGFDPYNPSVIVASAADLISLLVMAKPSTDPALLYALLDKSKTGGVPTIVNLPFSQMSFVKFNDSTILTSKYVLGIDKRFGLMGHRALGMDLVETDRIIDAKFEKIVISNYVGFSKVFASAAKILDITAISKG